VRACQRPSKLCRGQRRPVLRVISAWRHEYLKFGKKFDLRIQDWSTSGYLGRVGYRIHESLRSADRAEPH
jgi:hypothetical protein